MHNYTKVQSKFAGFRSQPNSTFVADLDEKYMEGIRQLKSAVECNCLTKGEVAIQLIGKQALSCFRESADQFASRLIYKLNSWVCQGLDTKFQSSSFLNENTQAIVEKFASDHNISLETAIWLELIDRNQRVADRRLIGVYSLSNGRLALAVFQVSINLGVGRQ